MHSLFLIHSSMFKVMHLDWTIDRVDCRTKLIHCSNDIWALSRSLSYVHYFCYHVLYSGLYRRWSSYFSDHLVSSSQGYKNRQRSSLICTSIADFCIANGFEPRSQLYCSPSYSSWWRCWMWRFRPGILDYEGRDAYEWVQGGCCLWNLSQYQRRVGCRQRRYAFG